MLHGEKVHLSWLCTTPGNALFQFASALLAGRKQRMMSEELIYQCRSDQPMFLVMFFSDIPSLRDKRLSINKVTLLHHVILIFRKMPHVEM